MVLWFYLLFIRVFSMCALNRSKNGPTDVVIFKIYFSSPELVFCTPMFTRRSLAERLECSRLASAPSDECPDSLECLVIKPFIERHHLTHRIAKHATCQLVVDLAVFLSLLRRLEPFPRTV